MYFVENQYENKRMRFLYIREKLKAELPVELSYHNLWHTLDVVAQSRRIALSEGIHDERRITTIGNCRLFS